MTIRPSGSSGSRIMIVQDMPGFEDERHGEAFCGSSGYELGKMLNEAGLSRSEVFCTTFLRDRPPAGLASAWIAFKKSAITPEHIQLQNFYVLPLVKSYYDLLLAEIEMVKPDTIIAMGSLALWALFGEYGVDKWRGSMLTHAGIKLMPTYHPSQIFRQYEMRPVALSDLKRVKLYLNKPWPTAKRNLIVRPSADTCLTTLRNLITLCDAAPTKLSVDIETYQHHMDCIGIAWSSTDAICIPFIDLITDTHYWNLDEESEIIFMLYQLLTHPNARCIGQNFIYDAQYIFRYWHFIPRVVADTMLLHHVLYPSMAKSLDFICSMHNEEYRYWKGDGKMANLKPES